MSYALASTKQKTSPKKRTGFTMHFSNHTAAQLHF